jgi:GxxExxY protein
LLESVYEVVLVHELHLRGLDAVRQVSIPIESRGERFDEGFRADIIVENKVILELKSVEKVNNIHKKQLLTYLKLSEKKLGFLLNFGTDLMKNGITQVVHNLPELDTLCVLSAFARGSDSESFIQKKEGGMKPPSLLLYQFIPGC